MLNLQRFTPSLLALALLALLLLGPSAVQGQGDEPPFFPETGFAVATDEIWAYFDNRGGVETFGYPVSQLFVYDGFPVQIFQRHVLQVNGDVVRPLNLLDPEVMPLNAYGGLTFPPYDESLAKQAPVPSTPNYGTVVADYIDSMVDNQWQGEAVDFRDYFYSAAPDASGPEQALIALEVWGFPTSKPASDPNNSSFIYQRFQRGIMHYDKVGGVTWGILLGDAFKERVNPSGTGGTPAPPSNTSDFIVGVEITRGAFSEFTTGKAVEAGATMVRASGIFWDEVEATPGVYDWSQMARDEENMRLMGEAGLAPMMIFRNTPTWARETPSHLCSAVRADALDEFAAFVEATVERYSVPPYNVHHWEMFNEPDIDPALVGGDSGFGCWGDEDDPYYNGDQYAAMLKAAYPAIKRADPTATVYLGGLLLDCDPTTPPASATCQPSNFFEGILRGGGAPYFDVVAYHAYGLWNLAAPDADANHPAWDHRGGAVIGKASFLRDVMAGYGLNKPVIMNEGGLLCREGNPDCPGDRFFDDQARYVPKLYARAWASRIEGAFWYTLNGPGWRNGGMLVGQNERPAYQALKTFTEALEGARYVSMNPSLGPEGYEFQRGDRLVHIYWTNGIEGTIPRPEGTVEVYDYLGRPVSGTGPLTVGAGPIYVEIER